MPQRQRGFSLLEIMLAMTIMMGLAAGALWLSTRTRHMTTAQAQGTSLLTLGNALNTYATSYFTPLVNGTTVAGVASEYAPTLAELKTLGLLGTTFSALNSYGGSYVMSVSLAPAGCVPPACDLATLASLSSPIIDSQSQRVDTGALGSAAQTAGGNAGYSSAAAPGTISGLGGAWSVPNPAGNVVGILAIRGGYGASGLAQFTRRDGSAPPTGPWNMAGINVSNINALGSTTLTSSGAATVGGTLGVAGTTTTNTLVNSGALTNNGAATITGPTTTSGITNTGNLSNTGNITNGGDVLTGRVDLQTVVANGAPCPGLNGYQAATAAGSIASCINGTWTTPNAAVAPPPPCPSTTVTWGSGCSGAISGTTSGNPGWVNASYGAGSATFVCAGGSWLFQSGTCSIPCSGTYSWGGGMCSASYSMATGAQQSLTYALGGPRGGSYSGSATITCNNGSVSPAGTSTCQYSNPDPTLYNAQIPSQSDLQLAANPTSAGSYCSMVLPGSTGTYSAVNQGQSGLWTCWNNSGYNCNIAPDGSNCGGGVNGCSCWSYAPANGNNCYTVTNLTCTRTGL